MPPGGLTRSRKGWALRSVTNLFNTAINAYPVAFSAAPAGGRTFRVALGVRF
jgi:hypothetical protein